MKVALMTLGCKVNYYESEKVMKAFAARGCDIVEFTESADIYLINTCTVTNIADRKSRQMIHRAAKMAPDAVIVAVGCYVESAGESVRNDPDIDIAFSNRDKSDLAEKVLDFWMERNKSRSESMTGGAVKSGTDMHKKRTRAFIKVQDGCNQFCSYCLIPFVRGRGELNSTPADEVVREISERVENGCSEVVLTGIHLSSYGVTGKSADGFVKEGGAKLVDLIRQVQGISGLRRIRLGSLEPRIITEEWVGAVSDCDKLCPHFHLSLQSGCDAVLSRMNRHYTTSDYKKSVNILRKYYDEPAVTTDVIVGFPGETDEEFRRTVDFLDDIGFADLHIFQYSMRNGTRAAAMSDQVSPSEKKKRSEELIGMMDTWHARFRERSMKIPSEILFEEYIKEGDDELLAGYDERYQRFGVNRAIAEERGWRPGMVAGVDRNLFLNL
ncbi:MAG: tRNA (N(6)-L-threonylcarbamoyladenosine(37)-C(2))-methylthiotransferase MtaB [Eubacterium sp.]|nr:tRNA (N(6)-L-threonylcarbamoyladenosine(37)-C(2))-methylthiotransferase MtaB [Eubacterium sp.]